ncbi:hypothetical protein BT67DRAFT_341032, partial [Trichocladium antarcticum]
MSAVVESPAAAANPTALATAAPAQDVLSIPRKFKASDLPLPSATRTAIEGLAHSFKKKGGYDTIRKQVWEKFEASDYEAQVTKAILEVAEQEVERNPTQLLTLERGKAAALIDGALDRGGVYQKAEEVIGALIDSRAIEAHIRQLRRAEIGDEAAEEERNRGAKTDMQYAAETTARRAERERVRTELKAVEEKKRQLEREIKAREDMKRREVERAAREERRKKEREEDERRDKERRERREKERELEREREKEREREREERHRNRSRDRDRDGDRDRDRDRFRLGGYDSYRGTPRDRSTGRDRDRPRDKDRDRDRRDSRDSRPKPPADGRAGETKKELTKEDHERLEQEALADLLRESKRVATKQPELEVDAALVPPPKRTKPASAINPIHRPSSRPPEPRKLVETKEIKVTKDPASVNTPKGPEIRLEKVEKPERRKSRTGRGCGTGETTEDTEADRDRERTGETNAGTAVTMTPAPTERTNAKTTVKMSRQNPAPLKSRPTGENEAVPAPGPPKQTRGRTAAAPDAVTPAIVVARRVPEPNGETVLAPGCGLAAERGVGPAPEIATPVTGGNASCSRSPRPSSRLSHTDKETWKQAEVKKREQEAKAYLAAQKEARAKGMPIPGIDDRRAGERSPDLKRRRDPEEADRYLPHERDRDRAREGPDYRGNDRYGGD